MASVPSGTRPVIDDRHALTELAAVSDITAVHTILHYLYFTTSDAAADVARQLDARGFDTEQQNSGESEWTVVARHYIVPSESQILATRRWMESLVIDVGGEYDGWAAEVRPA